MPASRANALARLLARTCTRVHVRGWWRRGWEGKCMLVARRRPGCRVSTMTVVACARTRAACSAAASVPALLVLQPRRSHPRCLFGSRVEAWRRATRLLDIAAGAARALKDARTLKDAGNTDAGTLAAATFGQPAAQPRAPAGTRTMNETTGCRSDISASAVCPSLRGARLVSACCARARGAVSLCNAHARMHAHARAAPPCTARSG